MTTLFISDIHLGSEHPEISERFTSALAAIEPGEVDALYILGDLFEAWIGDDGAQPEHHDAIAALQALSARGLPLYVMHGNRDFLLGTQFAAMTGCQLLADPVVIDLYGHPTLLSHGDILCTDDNDYQGFRQMVRAPAWQQQFLAASVEQRLAIARQYRGESQSRSQQKSMAIMDVNQEAVENLMREHGVDRLIHGHTHRPAVHRFELDGRPAERIVLGDWYTQNSLLVCDESGCELRATLS